MLLRTTQHFYNISKQCYQKLQMKTKKGYRDAVKDFFFPQCQTWGQTNLTWHNLIIGVLHIPLLKNWLIFSTHKNGDNQHINLYQRMTIFKFHKKQNLSNNQSNFSYKWNQISLSLLFQNTFLQTMCKGLYPTFLGM